MIYLASPYSHPDPLIRRTRFLIAEQVSARLIQSGIFIYSPIVHCHAMAEKYELNTSFNFWKFYNIDMLRKADELYILKIDGWDISNGVQAEFELAKAMHLPYSFVDRIGEKILCV